MYKLKDGVVGSQMVAHFEKEGKVAVRAESLTSHGLHQHDYRITFEHGISQLYRVTFGPGFGSQIIDIAPMN